MKNLKLANKSSQANSDLNYIAPKIDIPIFRPIHYLGSKLRILESLGELIDELDPSNNGVCDLFAGSGTVSSFLSRNHPVTSVDIQEYSKIICSALLKPEKNINTSEFIGNCLNSDPLKKISHCIAPLLEYEEYVIDLSKKGNPEPLCEFLEEGSLARVQIEGSLHLSKKLKSALNASIKLLEKNKLNNSPKTLSTRYFGGLYFSYFQSIQFDAILEEISLIPSKNKMTLMAALLSTVSETVNTVGKQFAQPIQPRNPDGTPKSNLHKRIEKDRKINVFDSYQKWLEQYKALPRTKYKHTILSCDFKDALLRLNSDTKTIYADPPYTRDHYSRFYHVLETISLRDLPELSKTKIGNEIKLSRALYREGRHQSPFCIKSKASESFDFLFKQSSKLQANLILSYSPFEGNERPRVVTIKTIKDAAKKYFKYIDIINLDELTHSKLNHRQKNLETKTPAEIIIICQNKS